jgi:hypothetical protein
MKIIYYGIFAGLTIFRANYSIVFLQSCVICLARVRIGRGVNIEKMRVMCLSKHLLAGK